MGRVEGRVALITGAARGQGRAHALRLAQEGADIVAWDALTAFESVRYEMPGEADLAETARMVSETGRAALTERVDIRDRAGMSAALDRAIERFGGIDIVIANAGIIGPGAPLWEIPESEWGETIDINLKGTWNTLSAVVPPMIERGRGGSIVITSSVTGIRGAANIGDYSASKHGIIGLGRTLAIELASHRIRVNMLAPGSVGTTMVLNPEMFRLFCPDLENPTVDDARERFAKLNPMGVPWLEPVDVANAALWLASDEARYVTGAVIPIDSGWGSA